MEKPRNNDDIDLPEEEFYIIEVLAPENCVSNAILESIPDHQTTNHDSDKKVSFRQDVKISNTNSNKNRIFACDDCNISFNKKSFLVLHLKQTHTEVKSTKFKLDKTGNVREKMSYRTVNSTYLQKHQLAAHGNKKENVKYGSNALGSTDQMKYVCNKCNNWFCSAEQLKKHKYKSKCRIYKCDKCTYACYERTCMTRHIVKHADELLFPCSMCDKVFKTKLYATQHVRTHSDFRLHTNTHNNFLCDLCGFACLDAIEFDNHKPCLNLNNKYVCTCGRRFTDSSQLKVHAVKEHSTETIYSCGSCDYITLDESILSMHINSHCNGDLNKNMKYKCSNCDYSSLYLSNLKKHELKHNDERPFKCSKCVLKFKSKESLFKHYKIHKKHFKCSVCERIFQSLSKLKKHIFTHEGIKEMFKCSECAFISSTVTELDVHKESHDDAKKFICDECGLRFKFSSFLKRHQKQHLRPVNVMFSCNQCSYCTTRTEAFKKHMQVIHQETVIVLIDNVEENISKQHLCEFCDYATDRKSNLTAHILTHVPLEERKNIKKDEKEKYFCNHCSYTSPSLINLRNHLRCHTNGEKFSCNKCPFSCKLLKYLKQHEVTHMDMKPYLCNSCTRSFRKMRDLKKHAAVHENKNALQCDLCDYICLCAQGMKKHKSIVHKAMRNKNKSNNVDEFELNSDICTEGDNDDNFTLNIKNDL